MLNLFSVLHIKCCIKNVRYIYINVLKINLLYGYQPRLKTTLFAFSRIFELKCSFVDTNFDR